MNARRPSPLVRHARRLAPVWSVDCHVGAVAQVILTDERTQDGATVRVPAHFVAAAWPPAGQGPTRWPDAVIIASSDPEGALAELLSRLPDDARLHLVPAPETDFALAVTIVMEADRNLEDWQRAALRDFVRDWREAEREAILQRYSDRDAGFERFMDAVTRP